MKEMIRGMIGSFLIYLALPDVGLTKPQTVLTIIGGWMLSTAVIWWVEERIERHNERKRREAFREQVRRTTL